MGGIRLFQGLVLAPALVLSASAGAQEGEALPTPGAVQALRACRSLTGAEAKASCYDAAVDSMIAAVESGELVAVERSEIERAQRDGVGLPSFRVPGLGLFAASEEDEQPLTIRIVALERSALGAISFDTDAGHHWVQVGSDSSPRMPDPPLDAELEPALGDTWFVTIPGRTPVRVKRER